MDRKAMQKGPSLICMRHLCAISLNFARLVDHDSGRNKVEVKQSFEFFRERKRQFENWLFRFDFNISREREKGRGEGY